mgnify:CR=1 FL=1
MKKIICLIIVFLTCSIAVAFGQTEDYSKLASDAFNNGSYSQALVYCSMYAVEYSERLPIEIKVKQCLEYERQFDEAALNSNLSLAKVFYNKIIELNPADKRIKDRLSALQSQINSSMTRTVYVPTTPSRPYRRKAFENHFNFEFTLYKDLEINFNMNFSWFLLGVSYGWDIWKGQRFLTEPARVITPSFNGWQHTEIVHPMHLMLHGGLYFKYIAFDCGVGYVFAKTRTASYSGRDDADKSCYAYHEHTNEKREAFFTYRPEIKVFIPFTNGKGNDCHWIFSFGYNLVPKANCSDGLTISTGCGWAF